MDNKLFVIFHNLLFHVWNLNLNRTKWSESFGFGVRAADAGVPAGAQSVPAQAYCFAHFAEIAWKHIKFTSKSSSFPSDSKTRRQDVHKTVFASTSNAIVSSAEPGQTSGSDSSKTVCVLRQQKDLPSHSSFRACQLQTVLLLTFAPLFFLLLLGRKPAPLGIIRKRWRAGTYAHQIVDGRIERHSTSRLALMGNVWRDAFARREWMNLTKIQQRDELDRNEKEWKWKSIRAECAIVSPSCMRWTIPISHQFFLCIFISILPV